MRRFPRVLIVASAVSTIAALALAVTLLGSVAAAPRASAASSVSLFRSCGPATRGFARCHAIVRVESKGSGNPRKQPTPTPTPTGSGGGSTYPTSCANPTNGYTPCDLVSAYNLASAAVSTGGTQTVALVDAYNDPNAESDLGVFRAQFGLHACTTANGCFKKVNQSGVAGSYPTSSGGWSQEISLDLDMVSAICPNCHILLVEASSSSLTNLGTAVNTAATLGATEISNSYGGSESSSDPSYDTTYYDHPGIVITASSGDGGYGVEYPAASQFVTSVGGTSLTRDASAARGWSETVWSTSSTEGAGSGCSAYDPQPSWQNIASITGTAADGSTLEGNCHARAVADVSAVADPYTGVDVYDSYSYQGLSGWLVFGGTSVASPLVASVYALAGNASSVTYGSYPYGHSGSLYDVTSGSTASCGSDLCTAAPGWDGPTGLGTPDGAGGF